MHGHKQIYGTSFFGTSSIYAQRPYKYVILFFLENDQIKGKLLKITELKRYRGYRGQEYEADGLPG
jgi:hypothetical protein